ncbi:hypothetical protein [Paenibacillus elgii]|uniref:hypothetical protein n=1 Tax=Paenibacillus elgii TaxID=189691 RepID=UPI00203E36AC|nr:hypothetical protein [Paenibacillus elgii]MCM3273899.1 hypothetical protein [Paenibacillus elgii]
MPTFNNLKELEKHLNEKIAKSLKNEVAKATVKTMQEEIKETVYNVYEPKVYHRHYYQGGLLDPDNIEVEVTGDNSISVENIRHDGEREVAYIVETGDGYYSGAPSVLTNGRRFTASTRKRLIKEDILRKAMKDGLNRQGIDTR